MSGKVDLVKIFSTVAKTMVENKTTLNEADDYNKNHGDNMVDIFNLITGAMKEAPQGNVASGLSSASELLTVKRAVQQICMLKVCPRPRNTSRARIWMLRS